MAEGSWRLLGLLLAFFLAGGYFACAEMAFTSVNAIRMKGLADQRDRRANKAVYVLDNFDRALSTLLVCNNIAHIAAATIAALLVTRLWGERAVAAMSVCLSIAIFLVAEMIPKRAARDRPEQVSLALAGSLILLMRVTAPLTWLFMRISRLADRIAGEKKLPSVTEEELYELFETIAEEGALEPGQSRLIQSAITFADVTAQDVLTARVDLVAVEYGMSCEEILSVIKENKYSRLPVYKDTLDSVAGVLNVRRFVKHYLEYGESTSLSELMTPPYFVHKTKAIDALLADMSAHRQHMAVVTDDRGGTMGIVTVEDILEELVGEIWDEGDVVREDFVPLGGGRYEVGGDLYVLHAFEQMGEEDNLTEDELQRLEHKTVSAWAQEGFEGIPKQGDSFVFGGVVATVLLINSQRRITKVLLRSNVDVHDIVDPDVIHRR